MRGTTRRKELDLSRVRAAIEDAERRTSAEIVVSVAPFFVGSVWRAARRAFDHLRVADTQRRNGVLVFVVPARRDVIVLADDGAYARFDPGFWQDIASRVAEDFARGDGTAGLVGGIDQLASALAGPFPRTADDVNELPDQPSEG